MRDIIPQIEQWLSEGKKLAIATIIGTQGSSLRGIGAKMVFTEDGLIAGSVSGGCVEGAVFECGVEVLRTGKPQHLHFGKVNEADWNTVGLSCGGQIDVFINRLDDAFCHQLSRKLTSGQSFFIATIIDGSDDALGRQFVISNDSSTNGHGFPGLYDAAMSFNWRSLTECRCCIIDLNDAQFKPARVFVEAVDYQPKLVIVGGAHIAVALVTIAKTLGFQTILVDPREAFGSADRFPHVDRLISAWPQVAFEQIAIDPNTALVMLTHDPKIDDPAIKLALHSPAFYVGALGSKLTQQKRRERLQKAGFQHADLARLHGPVGLNLGGETPAEIALEIMAEIVGVRHRTVNTVKHNSSLIGTERAEIRLS